MNYKLLDGKATSLSVQEEIASEVKDRVNSGKKRPHLAAVLIGDDAATATGDSCNSCCLSI